MQPLGRAVPSPTARFLRRRASASVTHGPGRRTASAPLNDPQYPAFDFGDLSFMVGQARAEETFETTIQVTPAEPLCSGIGILLMGVAAIAADAVAPQRRINFNGS